MKMISSSAYEAVRGICTLPCGLTLQDYTHFIKAGVGVQPEVTNQLVKEANVKQEYQVYVAIVFDEMKIKGLVYDKNECRIIGFIDLGPVNNAFASFERTLDESGGHTVGHLQTGGFFSYTIAPVVCPGRIVSTKSLTHTEKKRGTSTSFLICHI